MNRWCAAALALSVSGLASDALTACGGDTAAPGPSKDGGPIDGEGITDSGLGDTFDDAALSDAGFDAGPTTYNDLTDVNNWAAFTPSLVFDGGASPVQGYAFAAFDGRYVYFLPGSDGGTPNGNVLRYDSTADWSNASSWSVYELTALNPSAKGFFGGMFDGRYLYLTPFSISSGTWSATFARYDTTAPFTTPSSWSFYDGSAKTQGGFGGAVFDGRYAYFVPYSSTSTVVMRYDTTASFTSGGSWSVFDTTQKGAGAAHYLGAAFDGKYVYFAPSGGGTGNVFLRYDTSATFTLAGSWQTFDLLQVNASSLGFAGAVYDGRYINLIPCCQLGVDQSTFTRYDSQGSFTDKAAYASYDLTQVNSKAARFIGGVFDGRYLYMMPNGNGFALRYDTSATMNSPLSYSAFDMKKISGVTYPVFYGGAFDGEHVYFVQEVGAFPMLRFDAKTPASIPASYRGSFF